MCSKVGVILCKWVISSTDCSTVRMQGICFFIELLGPKKLEVTTRGLFLVSNVICLCQHFTLRKRNGQHYKQMNTLKTEAEKPRGASAFQTF